MILLVTLLALLSFLAGSMFLRSSSWLVTRHPGWVTWVKPYTETLGFIVYIMGLIFCNHFHKSLLPIFIMVIPILMTGVISYYKEGARNRSKLVGYWVALCVGSFVITAEILVVSTH